MVDKVIGELPGISSLDATSLFVAEQSGQAVKVSGKQLTDFSNVETTAQVEQAKASAQEAKTAQEAAEAAILNGPIIQNGTWCVYNQTAGAYQDTGIKATGPQGIPGPTASVNGISPDDSGNITLTASNVNAYSKTETDTLLQNKVPLLEKHLNDTHAFTNIGWYWVNAHADNMPMDMDGVDYNSIPAIMFVRFSAGSYAEIDLWFPSWSSGFIPHFRQKYVYGTWEPWCWVDPPMYIGVEYRTTERYLGKPVYVKAINFGELPSTGWRHVDIDNQNRARAIRVSGLLNNGTTIPGTDESQTDGSKPLQCYGYNNNVCIYAPYDASSKTAVVTAWYTKTTD